MFFSGSVPTVTLHVGEHDIVVGRARLQKYLLLEQYRAVKDVENYLKACGIPTDADGVGLLRAYNLLIRFNAPTVSLPVLRIKDQRKYEEPPWDYINRHIVSWVHMFISKTSMTLTEVMELDIDDFYALLQEILTEEQLEKEWVYGLSEIAYQYDAGSKTSRLVPLSRPVWMMNVLSKRRVKEVPDWLKPVGLVTSISPNASKSQES